MAQEYRHLLLSETENFNDLTKIWEKISSDQDLSEDIQGEIRSTIGKSQLLIAERFKQFSSLIDSNEFNYGEKPTTLQDLQGFWDLIYIQVQDVQNKFKQLDKLKENNWVEVRATVPVIRITRKKASAPSKTDNPPLHDNSRVLAARKRLAEAKAMLARPKEDGKENLKTFDATFFSVSSPVKQKSAQLSAKTPETPKANQSLRSGLTPQKEKLLLSLSKVNRGSRRALGEINKELQLSL